MNRTHPTLLALALAGGTFTLAAQVAPKAASATNAPAKSVTITPGTAAPASATTAAAARNIRFQFDGIPYADVIERFAQMANKPLLAGTKPEGTLTYNDPNAYTYVEALDTLNVILAMKGVMLVENANYLQLVPFKELPSTPLKLLRGTAPAGDVRPGEVVTAVLDAKNVDSKEITESLTSMLSSAGSMAVLPRGRGIIITDRLANIQRIKTLLATIDIEAPAERMMKTFALQNTSGAIVADLLNRTFGLATAPRRQEFNPTTKTMVAVPPDPNEYITAVYDDASRTMVLFGPRERIALAEELIAKFEQREGPAGDVRIYQLQSTKAEELAMIIRQAIPGVAEPKETGSAAATKARVIADSKDNRLIVASPVAAQLEQIDLLISRVDKGTTGNFSNTNNIALRTQTVMLTKVFRPRATEPKDFAAILTQALTRREPGARTGSSTASVTFDAASKSVVITGSPGDLQTATEILTQLETGTSQPQALQTRFIEVGTAADAKRLLPLVEELYRNQMSGAGSLESGPHAKLMSDDNGRLIVTASEPHLLRIEELVKQLRGKHGVVLNRQLSIIALKNTKLDTVFAGFEKLLADRMADRRYEGQPKPSVVADNANNRMLVTATPEQLTEIEQLVKVVDLAPATQRREMVVLPVRAKTPTEIITLATQLLAQMGGPGTDPQMEPKLIPDASGKQIIVLAAQKDLKRVQDLVTQLDTATTQNLARQFRSVDLHARTATELTPLVTQLYQEQLKGQSEPPGGAATVLADAKNNRIMVSGADAEITRVEAIIRQLDPAGRKPARDETRVIRLRSALAAEISGLVEKSLNAQAQTVKVLVDARSNSLVLSGEPDAVEAASKVIQQLDTPGDVQPREMRVMELKQGDATAIAALALPLVTELLKSQRGPEYSPSVKIVADAASNRLILSGPRNELLAVNTIVEQLDQAPEGAGGARVFKLNNADAIKVVGIVSNAMVRFDARNQPIRRVTVSADRESNSIVVAGTRADLKDAENIIQRLDNEGIDPSNLDKPKGMRLIEVRGDADALAALATKIFVAQSGGRAVTNLVSITPNGKRLIVLAPEPMLVQIEALVASLDSKPDELQRELHPIVLKNASATELLPKVTAIYSEQSLGKTQKPATIYADASGTRLNVFGTKQQAEAIQQIADTLAGGAPATRETKVIDLGKLAEAKRVMALALQLYKDQFAANPQLGAADAQMVSDGVSGRVIVSARADQMKAIEDIFTRLQPTAAAATARETRMIEVGTANDVARLLPIVQKLYTEQWKDRPETDPADAQIVADPQGGRVIVTGRPEHVKEIEGILQKLGTAKAKPQARETRLFDLTTASATELAVTVKLLYGESAKARFGNQSPDTLIMADTSANRLIAIGEVTELEAVADLVKKLDTTAGQSATARVFKIKSADPAKVAEVLTTALVRFDALGRPQKRVSVSVDAKTRTLIVTGDAKELSAVPAIIEQLDQSLGEQPARKIQVVQLNSATPNTLLSQARKLYDDQIKTQPELAVAELLVMDDASGSQLILAGSDAQLKLFSQILTDLQKLQPTPGERVTKAFDLGPADEVARLVPLVRSFYEEKWRTRPLSDPADATFLPDTRNGRMIVTARTNHLVEIEALLGQLRGAAATEPRATRFFDLTSSDAGTLAGTLRPLYLEQARLRPGSPARDTLILAETNSNRLIVTGTTNELAVVEHLVRELDKASPQSANARIFKLKAADPAQVTEILTNAFVMMDRFGRPTKRISVVVDAKNRSLIVTGEAKDLHAAAQVVEQLDTATGTNTVRSMRVFALKGRRATETAPKIRQVFEERARSLPDVGSAGALVIEDIPGNQLIFVGTEAQLALMQETADVMDKAGTTLGREVRVFPLERNSAAAVVVMLNRLFPRQTGTTDREDRLLISAGGDDNTLIVDATRTQLEQIEQLLRVMDAAPAGDKTTFHAVHLTKGKAEEVATAVTASFTAKLGRGKLPRTTVTPVTGANTLLINGPNGEVEDVLKIIQALDVEMKGDEIEIRIYKLENGTAKEVSVIIEQLLQGVSRTRVRAAAINVAVDPRANTLIISGTPAHFRVVEKVLPTLDKAPERSDRDVQFVWLKKAKAFDVSTKLDALFAERPKGEQPLIEPDVMNNSLTVIAKRADLAQIQDLVSRLDEQSKDNSIQVRLRPLDRVVAEQMAKMLQSIYPQMSRGTVRVVEKLDPLKPATTNAPAASPATNAPANPPAAQAQATVVDTNAVPEVVIAVDKNANSLLLSGPASELDNVERIIGDLSLNFYSNEAEFRLFPLKDADPIVVARTLNELLRMPPVTVAPQRPGEPVRTVEQPPRITVVAEQRTRSVVVRARPTDFALMESLIKQLDGAGQAAQLDFRSVPLTNAPPEKVLPLVQQMVTQLNLIRPGEPLTVVIDPRSRGLLVVAREAVIVQVEKMIQSLDKPAPYIEAEVMVFALKKANAAALALVLQNMIRPGPQGTQSLEARELQEQIRRLRVLGDNGEAVTLDLTKPIKISADGAGGGNRLVLTSTPDNLKALAAVVELMDTPQVVEGVNVRIIKLQHADAASVLTTVQSIFTQGRTLATGPGGPGAQPEGLTGKALVNPVGIGVDARSNTLILSGQMESIELASKLIEDLDKQLDHPVTEVKLFRLKHASATRLVAMLQSVFAEGPPVPGTEGLKTQVTRLRTLKEGANTPRTSENAKSRAALTIQADDLSNILIIAARSDMLPLIADVIDQLDIPSASGLETVRIFPLAHAEPAAVQKVLADLYAGQRANAVRNEDKPVITLDERTGALIVAGNAKSFAIVEGLLKQLDQKLPFDLRDIRILPLEHADANAVAGTLQKLMDARLTQRVTLNKGQSDALKVIILADSRSNALLVGGGRDGFEMVEALAKQLDTAGAALSGRIRLIPLQFADARLVGATLTTLFEQRYAAARTTDVQRNKPVILPDPRSNSLLITANQEDNRTIDELLQKLDTRMDNPSLQLTVLPLKHNDAARVAGMIESIFAARRAAQTLPGQPPLPSTQIKLEFDALNNSLVVSASKENLELIQDLLKKLDAEPVIAGGVLEVFTLQFADAARVGAMLSSLVQQGLYRPGQLRGAPAASAADKLAVTVDPRSNSLFVSASPETMAVVREVIKRMDTQEQAVTGDVRLFQLKHARASSLATTLTQFFTAKEAADALTVNANQRRVKATVIADDRVNTILVTGGKEAFDFVERILPQLDGEGTFSKLNFRVFTLTKATAQKLQATLQPIFANRPPRVRGEPNDPITIIADAWVNALLVGANVEDMTAVEALIKQLDAEPAPNGLAIHVFPLAKADVRKVALTVQGLFRDGPPGQPGQQTPVQVTADERINALVVSCGEVDARRIAELVKRLDTEQVARVAEIKVFPLKNARAETLSTILNAALNTKPAPLTDQQNPNAQSVLQFITRTLEGRDLITAALKESVLITPDPRMNSLIVSGPVDYMGLLEQIITRLDASSPQEAKIKVFTLKNASARQMADILTQMFRMTATATTASQRTIQYTLVRPGGTNDAASATLGTAEQAALTVTVDPRTNSLLVGGTDHYVTMVEQIIESLDSTTANDRRTEIVRLKNTQAGDVAGAVRSFLDQERQRVTQVLGADAVGTAQQMLEREVAVVGETNSNTLLLSASPRYFTQVQQLITELDKSQPQVMIQVVLAEVALTDGRDVGLEWNLTGGPVYSSGVNLGVANLAKNGFTAALTGGDTSFILKALKEHSKLEVLSRPQIVTADNKPATINVGQRVPLITDSRVTERGDTINSFRYEDIGVNLTVTPKISLDGFVKLELGTTNSSLASSDVKINASATVPVINQRRANTTVSVQNGQTIIIGGLIGTQEDRRERKVPFFGDIPYLGAAFRSTKVTKEKRELLIFLTPTIMANNQTPVPLNDPLDATREQLDRSRLKDELKRNDFNQPLLDSLFPPPITPPPVNPGGRKPTKS
ncbi:MAG: type II and III secretion system protein [Limisphaerales bacterium]|nr:MAG: type II and III secretion system protein [Limisphaerales bacterium]KAG0509396.1 MAG: type II and III secretion system protein [Limisphaerales bacterium]TXT52141.1 MAG: type II and III secretion system protein [Limisphaerales bacterium]